MTVGELVQTMLQGGACRVNSDRDWVLGQFEYSQVRFSIPACGNMVA